MHPIGCLLVLDFRYRVPEWTSSSLWTVVPCVDRGPSSCPPDGLGLLVIGVLRLVRGVVCCVCTCSVQVRGLAVLLRGWTTGVLTFSGRTRRAIGLELAETDDVLSRYALDDVNFSLRTLRCRLTKLNLCGIDRGRFAGRSFLSCG